MNGLKREISYFREKIKYANSFINSQNWENEWNANIFVAHSWFLFWLEQTLVVCSVTCCSIWSWTRPSNNPSSSERQGRGWGGFNCHAHVYSSQKGTWLNNHQFLERRVPQWSAHQAPWRICVWRTFSYFARVRGNLFPIFSCTAQLCWTGNLSGGVFNLLVRIWIIWLAINRTRQRKIFWKKMPPKCGKLPTTW